MSTAPSIFFGGEQRNSRHDFIPHNPRVIVQLEEKGANRLRELARRPIKKGDGLEALSRLGHICEYLCRQWLTEQRLQLDPRRMISYFGPDPDGTMRWQSREIDALCIDGTGRPSMAVEVRTSVLGQKGCNEKKFQLERSMTILRQAWPRIRGLIVIVSIGPEPIESSPNVLNGMEINHTALERAYRWRPRKDKKLYFPVLVIPFDDFTGWAERRGWQFDSSLVREAKRLAKRRWRRRTKRRSRALRLRG